MPRCSPELRRGAASRYLDVSVLRGRDPAGRGPVQGAARHRGQTAARLLLPLRGLRIGQCQLSGGRSDYCTPVAFSSLFMLCDVVAELSGRFHCIHKDV